jgi:tRNA-dihydrouridine synthase
MIGRAALGAPWVFCATPATDDDRARIIRRHCALIQAHLPERAALLQLKKHLSWYSGGRPFGARLRSTLFATSSAEVVQTLFWDHWHAATEPRRVRASSPRVV